MHERMPDWGGHLRTAASAASRGQETNPGKARPLLQKPCLRRDGQRRHAGSISLQGSLRKAGASRAWTGVSAGEDAALAAALLPILRAARRSLRGSGAGDSQELVWT